MTIDKIKFQKALLDFFNDCEKILSSIDLSKYHRDSTDFQLYKKENGISLIETQTKIVFWSKLLKTDFTKRIENLNSADRCVFFVRQLFGLTGFSNIATGELLIGDDLVRANDKRNKFELAQLFFSYKEKYENSSIRIEDFTQIVVEMIFSTDLNCKNIARLLGFNSTLKWIVIGEIEIRILDSTEITRIINNSRLKTSSPFKYTPIDQIAFGPFGANIFSEKYWIVKKDVQKIEKPNNLTQILLLKNPYCSASPDAIDDQDIFRLILSLRLFGNYSGIRTVFSKISLNSELLDYENWEEYQFKTGSEFHQLCNLEFGKNLSPVKERILNEEDIKKIEQIYDLVKIYQSKKIAQIDKSLEHYFLSYEQNYPVYRFTELMLAFESLLGEFIPPDDADLKKIIQKIRVADTDENGLKELNKYLKRNSAHKAIRRLKLLLAIPKKDRYFHTFFYNPQKTGCYDLRNLLLHGNIGLDHQEIFKTIPEFNEFVRKAILKVLDSYVNGTLKLTELNYFEELDKFIGLSKY